MLGYTIPKKYKITLAAFSGIFVCLFLLFFQPFGINNYRSDEKISLILILVVFAIAAIIFLSILFNEFIIRPLLFKTATILHFVTWLIFEIIIAATCTFLLYNMLGGFHDFKISSYLRHILELGTVLAFPFATTLFYFKHTSILKAYYDVLSSSKDANTMQEIVLLSGDYKNDQIALPFNTIVFIESEDNYVRLNYLEDLKLKRYHIRATLSSMEQKLTPEFFMRCNRSVIANLMYLESFKNHQKKLSLKLKSVPEPILISKSNQNKIRSFIEKKPV